MTQFMKAYAKKFTDLVSTTRMAAQRMAPLLRGQKAAEELQIMRNQHAVTKARCKLAESGAPLIDPVTGKPQYSTATGIPVHKCDYYPAGGPKWTPDGKMAWPAPPLPCAYPCNGFVG